LTLVARLSDKENVSRALLPLDLENGLLDDFYDELAPLYHLIFQDWAASVVHQGKQLSALIQAGWPKSRKVLDLSCGIGTQSIGLAQQGYSLVGSDISAAAVRRAQQEAAARHIPIEFSICDMRQAGEHHGAGFDVVISCDNSVPHLLTDEDLLIAFKEMLSCLNVGGGCIVTVRDYEKEERGKNILKPYGVRIENGKRYLIFQLWDFEGEHYDLAFFFVEEDQHTLNVRTNVLRSKYYAVSIAKLLALMRRAGFDHVRRIDDVFYQPVLVGTKTQPEP
jgi:SAM-dependent methyltransferase